MSNLFCFMTGMACGALAMYFTDPQGGRRRRAIARDKAYSWANTAADLADKEARHLRNRAYGTAIEARKAVTGSAGV
jgi:gas vesicle protein